MILIIACKKEVFENTNQLREEEQVKPPSPPPANVNPAFTFQDYFTQRNRTIPAIYVMDVTGANKTTVRWNAAINYNFMKDQRATIKLSAYDILNQNSNIVRLIASQNTLTYNRGNLLPRYFMMTLTYNIKQMPRK